MTLGAYLTNHQLSNRTQLLSSVVGTTIVDVQRHFKNEAAFQLWNTHFLQAGQSDAAFFGLAEQPLTFFFDNGIALTVTYFSHSRTVLVFMYNGGRLLLSSAGMTLYDWSWSIKNLEQTPLQQVINRPILGLDILQREGKDMGLAFHFEDHTSLLCGHQLSPTVTSGMDLLLEEEVQLTTTRQPVQQATMSFHLPPESSLLPYSIHSKGFVVFDALPSKVLTVNNVDYLTQLFRELQAEKRSLLDPQFIVQESGTLQLLPLCDGSTDVSSTWGIKVVQALLEQFGLLQHLQFTDASLIGKSHQQLAYNNQDALAWDIHPQRIVGVVCDGCGSQPSSEVGAQLAAQYVAHYLSHTETWTPQDLQSGLEAYMKNIAQQTCPHSQEAQASFLRNNFLFTLLAFVQTDTATHLLYVGDGCFLVNDEWTRLDHQNRPPYLAYNLLEGVPSTVLQTRVVTEDVQRLLLATDGLEDLLDDPFRKEQLEALLNTSDVFKTPIALQQLLSKHFSDALVDDTTLIYLAKK